MRVSTQPFDNANFAETQKATRIFLMDVLSRPRFSGPRWPEVRSIIYIDGRATRIQAGTWEINAENVYLAGASEGVADLERLAVLSGIARLYRLTDDVELLDAFSTGITKAIQNTMAPLWGNLVESEAPPEKLAVNMKTGEVAALINKRWVKASGAPVEVDDSWIEMEF